MKLGFEFECAAPGSWGGIVGSLRRTLGDDYRKVIRGVTADWSIRPPHRANVTYQEMEIITHPLPKRSALKYMNIILDWMEERNVVTNASTGLHSNYSDSKVQHRLNPVSVLTTIDTAGVLETFGRTKNKYCRPFEHYLESIKTRCQKSRGRLPTERFSASAGIRVRNSEVDEFVLSASKFMHGVYSNTIYGIYRDNFNANALSEFDPKRCCLNIGYIKRRGYVENRMMGNNYLHRRDLLVENIEDVERGLYLACDSKYNLKRNYRYLKEFYFS